MKYLSLLIAGCLLVGCATDAEPDQVYRIVVRDANGTRPDLSLPILPGTAYQADFTGQVAPDGVNEHIAEIPTGNQLAGVSMVSDGNPTMAANDGAVEDPQDSDCVDETTAEDKQCVWHRIIDGALHIWVRGRTVPSLYELTIVLKGIGTTPNTNPL